MLRLILICLLASMPSTGRGQAARNNAESIPVVVAHAINDSSICFTKRIPGIANQASAQDFPIAVEAGDLAIEKLRQAGISTVILFTSYQAFIQSVQKPQRPYSRYAAPAAGVALLLILLLAWNWALRRGIARHTRALAESELLFRELTEHIRDVFWVSTPQIDRLLYCSPAYESVWGRSVESLYADARSFLEGISPEHRQSAAAEILKGVEEGFDVQYPVERPDGTKRWIRDRGFPVRDAAGKVYRLVGIRQDMTEHKATEAGLRAAALELEGLSRRLVTLQETERKALARELHDRVGQYLTALNINLTLLSAELHEHAGEALRARLADSEILIEATAAAVRNVVSELHPPMLEEHGLVPALEWYAAEISRRTGLSIVVGGAEGTDRPSAQVEIALFRIAQEALNNVIKHAGARNVEILIECTPLSCMMTIDDDGVGMNQTEVDEDRHAGLGLITMRERAAAVDGSFEIQALPRRGTRLTVRAPAP